MRGLGRKQTIIQVLVITRIAKPGVFLTKWMKKIQQNPGLI